VTGFDFRSGAGFEPTSLGSRLKAVLIYHIAQNDELVYGITNGDGSGYNRKNGVQLNTKSKVEGAITNEE
jgi:hypothetical protein